MFKIIIIGAILKAILKTTIKLGILSSFYSLLEEMAEGAGVPSFEFVYFFNSLPRHREAF